MSDRRGINTTKKKSETITTTTPTTPRQFQQHQQWATARSSTFHKRRYKMQHEPERVVWYHNSRNSSSEKGRGGESTHASPRSTALSAEDAEEVPPLSKAALQMNSFFPESGDRGSPLSKKVKVFPSTPEFPSLTFDDTFESGNLLKVVRIDEHEYDLELRPDPGERGNTMWFYFQITNIPRPGKYIFNIVNLVKPESLYNEGLKPCVYSRREKKWQPAGGNCCYFASHTENGLGEHFVLSFELTFVEPPTAGVSAFDRDSYEYQNNLQHRRINTATGSPSEGQVEEDGDNSGGDEAFSDPTTERGGNKHKRKKELKGEQLEDEGTIPWYRDDVICLAHTFPFTYTDLSLYIASLERQVENLNYTVSTTCPKSVPVLRSGLTHSYNSSEVNNNSSGNSMMISQGNHTTTHVSIHCHSSSAQKLKFKKEVLCKTLEGRSCPVLYFWRGAKPSPRHIVITSRVHPGEANSSWVLKGFLDQVILNDSKESFRLLLTHTLVVVPMLNPDGVALGNYRGDSRGEDLNRTWRSCSKQQPTIEATKRLIRKLNETLNGEAWWDCVQALPSSGCAGAGGSPYSAPPAGAEPRILQSLQQLTNVAVFLDLHGHTRKKKVFMYGNHYRARASRARPPTQRIQHFEKLLPFAFSQAMPDLFSTEDCTYTINGQKEGAARVVVWDELNVPLSYTVETSFLGENGCTYTLQDYHKIGAGICTALSNFLDSTPSQLQHLSQSISKGIAPAEDPNLPRVGALLSPSSLGAGSLQFTSFLRAGTDASRRQRQQQQQSRRIFHRQPSRKKILGGQSVRGGAVRTPLEEDAEMEGEGYDRHNKRGGEGEDECLENVLMATSEGESSKRGAVVPPQFLEAVPPNSFLSPREPAASTKTRHGGGSFHRAGGSSSDIHGQSSNRILLEAVEESDGRPPFVVPSALESSTNLTRQGSALSPRSSSKSLLNRRRPKSAGGGGGGGESNPISRDENEEKGEGMLVASNSFNRHDDSEEVRLLHLHGEVEEEEEESQHQRKSAVERLDSSPLNKPLPRPSSPKKQRTTTTRPHSASTALRNGFSRHSPQPSVDEGKYVLDPRHTAVGAVSNFHGGLSHQAPTNSPHSKSGAFQRPQSAPSSSSKNLPHGAISSHWVTPSSPKHLVEHLIQQRRQHLADEDLGGSSGAKIKEARRKGRPQTAGSNNSTSGKGRRYAGGGIVTTMKLSSGPPSSFSQKSAAVNSRAKVMAPSSLAVQSQQHKYLLEQQRKREAKNS